LFDLRIWSKHCVLEIAYRAYYRTFLMCMLRIRSSHRVAHALQAAHTRVLREIQRRQDAEDRMKTIAKERCGWLNASSARVGWDKSGAVSLAKFCSALTLCILADSRCLLVIFTRRISEIYRFDWK
jgi:hypothetical protein